MKKFGSLMLMIIMLMLTGSAFATSIVIVNGDFETGSDNDAPPSGWTDNSSAPSFWLGVADETGNPTQSEWDSAPSSLGNFILTTARQSAGAGSQPVDGQLIQVVDLSPLATSIDAGAQSLNVDFIWASDDSRDTGAFSLRFFDASDVELGTGYSVALDDGDGYNFVGWFEETVGGLAPVGARSVMLQIDTTRTGGSETNIWIDNISLRNTVSNPSPTGDMVDVMATLSWDAPELIPGATYNVYFGTNEPNFNEPAPYGLTLIGMAGQTATTATPVPSPMQNGTTYHWVVDSLEPNDVAPYTPILHQGSGWSFTAAPLDYPPIVDIPDDADEILTWLAELPESGLSGVIDDNGEVDILEANIEWSVVAYAGEPLDAVAQVIDRSSHLGNVPSGEDPNLLRDWIGSDTRKLGEPLVLTLSGLPAGDYTWASTHYDLENQSGLFSVTVDGVTVGTIGDIGSGADDDPISTFSTTITSDGVNPIELVFDLLPQDQQPDLGNSVYTMFFVMNSFELTDGIDTLKVDFGRDNNPDTGTGATPIASGHDGYLALHEDLTTFTAHSYTLGSATITVLPDWPALLNTTVTKTSTGLSSTAELMTDSTGTFTIQLTATDNGGQSGSDTMTLRVAEDACDAAKINGATVNYYDVDGNCIVDLNDFTSFALEWLKDISLTASVVN